METIATTRRIGGSLVVTIPIEVVNEEQLVENQQVNLKITKRRINGFGILKGIGSYNREEDRMADRE